MSIEIEKIKAKDLGPLDQFSHQLGKFNVIYGPNEKGKTFLTEFILRSLFKNTKRWNVRKEGKGKIFLKGVEEKPLPLTISSDFKLDNFLEEEKGLPPQLSKLLVVKGSDAKIDENVGGGISKAVVKELLTEKGLLEKVAQNISKTIQKADIGKEPIDIDKRGEGKDLKRLKKELFQLNELIEEIEENYSPGYLEQLKIKKENLEENLNSQKKAKRYKAYTLNQKLEEVEKNYHQYDRGKIASLSRNIKTEKQLKRKIEKKKTDYQEKKEEAQKYRKLEVILENYKKLKENSVQPIGNLWGLISVGLFIISALITVLGNEVFGVFGFVITAIFIAYYFYRYKKQVDNKDDIEELKKLKKEFEEETGKKMKSIATLEATAKEYGSAPEVAKTVKTNLDELEEELTELFSEIKAQMRSIDGQEVDKDNWEEKLAEMRNKEESIRQDREKLKDRLSSLNIDQSDYVKEKPNVDYSAKEEERLKGKIEKKEEQIRNKQENLKSIEMKIAQSVNDDSKTGFSDLYQALHKSRRETEKELKEVKAEIVAGKIVFDQLEELRKKEDERIKENLNSKKIQEVISKMTSGKYKGVSLVGDKLEVIGELENFTLDQLSTGTGEQILLALRVGLSGELLKEDSMFLILDDAFQNSDWERREVLVQNLVDLAKEGWQIIYLTMDDHIRDLFQEKGKVFGDQFKSISL
jgi:DNA repair exonuclease SbcCD ATPase subunit